MQNILFAEGLSTGIALDIGELNCYASAIYEGHQVGGTGYLDINGISGRNINEQLAQDYAAKYEMYFTKSYDKEYVVRDIKEQCCQVEVKPN